MSLANDSLELSSIIFTYAKYVDSPSLYWSLGKYAFYIVDRYDKLNTQTPWGFFIAQIIISNF